jgi:hypothetical protein
MSIKFLNKTKYLFNFLFIFVTLFLVTPTYAADSTVPVERLFGQDWLGLQHKAWPLKTSLSLLPANSGVGILHGSFGSSMANIEAVLASDKVVAVRVHLVNGSCIRGKRCDSSRKEFGSGFDAGSFNTAVLRRDKKVLNEVAKRAKIYSKLAEKYPTKVIYLSPVLEHNLSLKAFQILADIVKREAPNTILVNNPMNARAFRTKRQWVLESHDPDFKYRNIRCISSPDGLAATDTDTKKYFDLTKECIMVLNWVGRFNGRVGDNLDSKGNFIHPYDRTHFPQKRHFEDLNTLIKYYIFSSGEPTENPEVCKITKPITKPLLWKTWADDHGSGDSRASKPLFISTTKSEATYVITAEGNRVATLPYYGTYPADTDGKQRYRYYIGYRGGSNLTLTQLVEKVENESGIEWAWLQQGDLCYGPFVPAYRAGFFREFIANQ